jgi:hypothetical protein
MSEWVATAYQDLRRGGELVNEPAHEHRLADAGLTTQEHDSPLAGLCVAQVCLQFSDARLALEQFHCATLPHSMESMVGSRMK